MKGILSGSMPVKRGVQRAEGIVAKCGFQIQVKNWRIKKLLRTAKRRYLSNFFIGLLQFNFTTGLSHGLLCWMFSKGWLGIGI